MAKTESEFRITPSVLDRLLDLEPNLSIEPPKSRSKSLQELKLAVRRDIEWLLNTRRIPDEIPETLTEVNNSVAVFGLPDFTTLSVKNPLEQRRLAKSLEATIKVFEPRLLDLRVTLEPVNDVERVLRFKIEARLDVDPVPEPIVFDTVLQLGSGSYQVIEK